MNNGDYIRSKLTDEAIAEYARLLWCNEFKCGECPFAESCNETFDKLKKQYGREPCCEEVIKAILKSGKDYVFYTHNDNNKHKPQNAKEAQYNYRNCCSVCGGRVNTYGLANILISGASCGPRVIAKVCGNCFPRLCKTLRIKPPSFIQPDFWVEWEIGKYMHAKADNSTYCHNCGQKNNPKNNYCPVCGWLLDK